MNLIKKRGKYTVWILISIIILCVIIAICNILPPSLGKMPLFYDYNGNVISGSLSEKTYIDVDGTELGILITGKDKTKPVLLFLGGGPGIPEYLLEHKYPTGLANDFVVCYLEYRGTSISYNSDMKAAQMTTDRYLCDVVAVTEYLKERFSQEKIYLMGHSFGTFIGIQAAYQHPELFHAYIAMSQLTNQRESEKIAYQFMTEQYRLAGNSKMVKEFENHQISSSAEAYQKYFSSSLRDNAMHNLGIGTTMKMNSVITGIFLPSLRCTVYTPIERINIWRSKVFISSSPVALERTLFNTFDEISSLDIPVYFFGGIYDYTCCYSLQKKYYEFIKAPIKGFYSFDNSAHSPLFEEPAKAIEIFKKDVLKGNNSLSD
ncbi:MAG: alpha/beta hydrolase [Proteocatella sp.]